VARTRKTTDKPSSEAGQTHDKDSLEDAVVIGEAEPRDAPPPAPETEAPFEETAPEASPEISAAEDVSGTAPDEQRVPDESPEPEPRPEAAPEPVAQSRPEPTARRGGSGAIALIFGGLIAALAGVAASRFVFPDGWPGRGDTAAVLADLQSAAQSQTTRIAELESALAALRDNVPPDPTEALEALRADLGAEVTDAASAASEATDRIGALGDQLNALAARIEELAARPAPAGLDGASLDAELSRFRSELSAAVEDARSQITAAQEEAAVIAREADEEAAAREAAAAEEAEATRAAAEAAAAEATRQAALTRVLAALESGEPFVDQLAALSGAEVPAALAAPAADGVPTQTELVESFPEAAREALDASIRAGVDGDALDRFTAFLRVQTGARSLEPRAGDDPDAVLSRAEAALRTGDLPATLSEISTLPEAGQAAMAGWIQSARTRLDALEAAQGLSTD
jgi:hypothetical protein